MVQYVSYHGITLIGSNMKSLDGRLKEKGLRKINLKEIFKELLDAIIVIFKELIFVYDIEIY